MRKLADAVYAAAITLWIGGLWAIGIAVVPILFRSLPDHALFGAIAGKFFTLVSYVGIGCAAYLLLFRMARFGGACFKQGVCWLLLLMLLLTLAGEFGVQPILAGLKDQALPREVMASVLRERFAAWHGVASVLYLIECTLGLCVVCLQGRDPR